jgi:hypothetical protein
MLNKLEGDCTIAAVDCADEVEGGVVWEDEESRIVDLLLALGQQRIPRLGDVDVGVDGIAVLLTSVDVLVREGDMLDTVVLIDCERSIDWRDNERRVPISLGCVQGKGTWLGGKMQDRNLVEARGPSDVAFDCFCRLTLHELVLV